MGFGKRILNGVIKQGVRWGLPPRFTHILQVEGRRSGKLRSVPLAVVHYGGARWLVGQVPTSGWVHNLRTAGRATLSRSGAVQTVTCLEVRDPEVAGRVLRTYSDVTGSATKKHFEAAEGDPASAWKAEAARHPVFMIAEHQDSAAEPGKS